MVHSVRNRSEMGSILVITPVIKLQLSNFFGNDTFAHGEVPKVLTVVFGEVLFRSGRVTDDKFSGEF